MNKKILFGLLFSLVFVISVLSLASASYYHYPQYQHNYGYEKSYTYEYTKTYKETYKTSHPHVRSNVYIYQPRYGYGYVHHQPTYRVYWGQKPGYYDYSNSYSYITSSSKKYDSYGNRVYYYGF